MALGYVAIFMFILLVTLIVAMWSMGHFEDPED